MDKRHAIVVAGVEQLEAGGLGSFSQARVAQRAGLRQSHLTYYFPSRRDLIVAVAEEAVRQRIQALISVVDAVSSAEKVAALAGVLTAPGQTRVLMALTQSADDEEGVRRALGALGLGIVPVGRSLLNAFAVAPTESALNLLQALSTGLAVLSLARQRDAFRPQVEQTLTDFLTHLSASTER